MNNTTDVVVDDDNKMHTKSDVESKGEDDHNNNVYNNNNSSDNEQTVTLADYEHLVAEGRKLIARVQSVAEKQQTWKVELEKFYINEEVQRIRSAALSEMVHESELESIDNAQFREWFNESNSRTLLHADNGKTDSETDSADLTRSGKWFYSEELTLLTPFAAVIPFPSELSAHGGKLVEQHIDNMMLSLIYVQTISAKANLWHVAQNYFRLENNGQELGKEDDNKYVQEDTHNMKVEEDEDKDEDECNELSYIHTPCSNGSDVTKLIRECSVLVETLRHTPCLLINDAEPHASLCGRCLVIRNQCVAAEILLSPRKQDTHKTQISKETRNDTEEWQSIMDFNKCKCSDVVKENDKSNNNSENENGNIAESVTCKCTTINTMQNVSEEHLREVIGSALQTFITEKVQPHMTCRTYMILFIAHINKCNSTNIEFSETCVDINKNVISHNDTIMQQDKVMCNAKKDISGMAGCPSSNLNREEFTLQEDDIRFEILNIDRADTTAFTFFSVDELCTVAGYVLRRNDKIDRDYVSNDNIIDKPALLHTPRVYLPPIIRLKRVNNLTTNRCKATTTNLLDIPLQIDKQEVTHDTITMCIRYAEKALAKRLEDNVRYTQSDMVSTKVDEAPKLFTLTTIDAKKKYESDTTTKSEQKQEDKCGDFQIEDLVACNIGNEIKNNEDNNNDTIDNRHNREETDNWWTRARRTALRMMVALKMRMFSPQNKYVEHMAHIDMEIKHKPEYS